MDINKLLRSIDNLWGNTDYGLYATEANVNSSWPDSFTRDEKGVTLAVVMPGYKKEDIRVATHDNFITITANGQKETYVLGDNLDYVQASAKYEAGILYVRILFKPEAEEKLIPIV